MTVIAWDGKTLAADKRATTAGLARTVTKIFRHEKSIIGFSGSLDQGLEMVAWFRSGADSKNFPASQRDKDDWVTFVVVDAEGVSFFERTPQPCKVEDSTWATGSGRDFAIAAMYCGKSACEAVEIACKFETGCGNGIDVLCLEGV
jgi:ATP-dependent protease HslVU (ClpYQ) peptidase subunit